MKTKQKRGIGILIIAFAFLFSLETVLASGCCFDSTTGICSSGSESSSCTGTGTTFYDSFTCSISDCNKGCCSLGTDTEYVTSRTCWLHANEKGLGYVFQTTDQETCENLGNLEELGACVFGEYYPRDCSYGTRGECGGEFYAGLYCTNKDLNTSCEVTTETTCYDGDENVHYVDSCDNIADLKETCNYDAGTICSESGKTAYCKDLNCVDAEGNSRSNGEKWCQFDSIMYADPLELHGEGMDQIITPVGSRFFSFYCLNGEVEQDPCPDFREGTCVSGECEKNPWGDCLSANEPSTTGVGNTVDEEKCDSNYCYIHTPMDCVDVIKSDGTSAGDFCGENRNDYNIALNANPGSSADERASWPLQSLHLNMCLPIVPGGQMFYEGSSSSNEAEDICALGNFETTVKFRSTKGTWFFWVYTGLGSSGYDWGNAGLLKGGGLYIWNQLSLLDAGWNALAGGVNSKDGSPNPFVGDCYYDEWCGKGYCEEIYNGARSTMPISKQIIEILDKRCSYIGDCAGNANWIGVGGEGENENNAVCDDAGNCNIPCALTTEGGDYVVKCDTFKYECKPYKAPDSSDSCEECGKDNLQCSEYRCMSLGQHCEYKTPDGADTGYCVKDNDYEAPTISLVSQTPANPVPPYEPVTITIATSEMAKCKFNIDSAGGSYDDMDYDFGGSYNMSHTTVLNFPGQTYEQEFDESSYSLLATGKDYMLYVRCVDASGNGDVEVPFTIDIETLPAQDTSPPILSEFSPASGSAIKYNTTEKTIKFKISEPAECKWSFNEEDYDIMNNSFSCDTKSTTDTIVYGYWCSGKLTNVSLNSSSETGYYIKCKDQPSLGASGSQTISGVTYSRNKHDSTNDYTYKLKPSEIFTIDEISPEGSLIVGGTNTSFILEARTAGGGSYGVAECDWRLADNIEFDNSTFTKFSNTNSNNHKQTITDRAGGNYYISVRCKDSSENTAEKNASLNLIADTSGPEIARFYNKLGLYVYTPESSICYLSTNRNDNCFFNLNNATPMSGYENMHTTEWNYDKFNYIRCKDYYGNENSGCAMIIRTF